MEEKKILRTTGYDRGSEWRRWELHLHTPGTLKNDQFSGASVEEKWKIFYSDIREYIGDGHDPIKNIAAIGITDYLSVDNYFKVISDRALPDSIKLVLPNVELRISPVTGRANPVNMHCIFSPKIAEQLENRFFAKLKLSYKDSMYSAAKSELIRMGKDIKNNANEQEALRIAAERYVISMDALKDIFADDSKLRNETIIVVSNKSTDGASGLKDHLDGSHLVPIREEIYNMADAVFSSNEKDIIFFGSGRDGYAMPCFHGCDAHDNSKIFKPDLDRFCWIKANPTFLGLKQALNEPTERVFIGEMPEIISRVNQNKTKYINELNIDSFDRKKDKDQIWFESNIIPFNNELVAVIGNKGSGKSALADIIALCGNAAVDQNDFMFLNKDRFKKGTLAKQFFANIKFESMEETEDRSLFDEIKSTEIPKVQYIPQQYFEKVCNEIDKVESFRKEVEKVVFQYIPIEKRLGKISFNELMIYKNEVIEREISHLGGELKSINREIIRLENKKHPDYIKKLENEKIIKVEEFDIHNKQEPTEIPNPETPETKTKRGLLEDIEAKLKHYEQKIKSLEEVKVKDSVKIFELEQFERNFKNEISSLEEFISQNQELLEELAIEISKVISLKYDFTYIDKAIKLIEDKQKKSESELVQLKGDRESNEKELKEITETLSQAEKDYQKYLEDKKRWDQKGKEIKEAVDTFEEQIMYIKNDLEDDLETKREERISISMKIYHKKVEIKDFYDEIKTEMDKKLTSYAGQNITIDSSFSLNAKFQDDFLSFINKNRAGSFRSQDGGRTLFQDKLIEALEPNDASSVESFLKDVIEYLEYDMREEESRPKRFICDQIQRCDDFYSYLFSLGYLEPHYELKQNDKNLEELSPGEKGALLLIFYLILDKNDIPLIIDQPEDNLDNHSVAQILVPYIKEAKKKRQIIMITHNPNLAVVADAEQIVCVNIDKKDGNRFSFVSGGIEDPIINQKIVDILEGTMPAFTTRKNKYRTSLF